MEKRDARLFQQAVGTSENLWNIVELESRKQLRQKVNEYIRCANSTSITTSEMRNQLLLGVANFGNQLATQLVRSLKSDDFQTRQSIVWLLILLDDKATIPLLHRMALDTRLSRSTRLSASLALAGMGVTAETIEERQRPRLYAIS